MSVPIYDLRDQQRRAAPRTRIIGGRTVQRPASQIDTIVLHQTAVKFGAGRAALRLTGGDREAALARRALRVAAHAVAFRSGIVALGHPLRSYVHGAGPVNNRSLHLEVEGLYSGLLDDPTTAPREDILTTWRRRKPDALDARTIRAAQCALWRLVSEGRRAGMPLRRIIAHRQTSPTRRSDPGEALWREIVLRFAVPCLGLKTEPQRTWGRGRPIPVNWDPDNGIGRF